MLCKLYFTLTLIIKLITSSIPVFLPLLTLVVVHPVLAEPRVLAVLLDTSDPSCKDVVSPFLCVAFLRGLDVGVGKWVRKSQRPSHHLVLLDKLKPHGSSQSSDCLEGVAAVGVRVTRDTSLDKHPPLPVVGQRLLQLFPLAVASQGVFGKDNNVAVELARHEPFVVSLRLGYVLRSCGHEVVPGVLDLVQVLLQSLVHDYVGSFGWSAPQVQYQGTR